MRNVMILLTVLFMLLGGIASSLSQESIEYLNNAPDEVVQMMRNALTAKAERDIYKQSYTDTLKLVNEQTAITDKLNKQLQKVENENQFLWIGVATVGTIAIGELFFLIGDLK